MKLVNAVRVAVVVVVAAAATVAVAAAVATAAAVVVAAVAVKAHGINRRGLDAVLIDAGGAGCELMQFPPISK
jgi:hypothetical protein